MFSILDGTVYIDFLAESEVLRRAERGHFSVFTEDGGGKSLLEEKENRPGSPINLPLEGMDCALGTLHVWAGEGGKRGYHCHPGTGACSSHGNLGSLSLSEPHTQDKTKEGQGCSPRNMEKHLSAGDSFSLAS